jgi:hypothetical protein
MEDCFSYQIPPKLTTTTITTFLLLVELFSYSLLIGFSANIIIERQ